MAPQPRSVFSAVFAYFGGGEGGGGVGGFLRKKCWLLGLRPRPRWGIGASSVFSKRTNDEFKTTIDIDQVFGTLSRWFIGALNMHIG